MRDADERLVQITVADDGSRNRRMWPLWYAARATELSPALSRDDKVRLWNELTSRLNFLGPQRKEPDGWKRY